MNAAAKKTDPIDLTTWSSPRAGGATVRPPAPALARRRGHGYELAPPSPRNLIARAVVPVLPAELARPAHNRSARRRLPRTARRASGALIAALELLLAHIRAKGAGQVWYGTHAAAAEYVRRVDRKSVV